MSALLGHAPVARPTDPAELTQYLYENYGQRVFTFCYSRLRDREEAQDAAQTTFIYVLRSLQRGVEPEFELAWLLKIAFNVCRGTRRSSGRQTAVTQVVEDMDELAAPQAAGPLAKVLAPHAVGDKEHLTIRIGDEFVFVVGPNALCAAGTIADDVICHDLLER